METKGLKLRHICEVCGKEELLTSDEAYEKGWDYPPFMGEFGVLSPRTCPNCLMKDTLWYKFQFEGKTLDTLTDKEKDFLVRISMEPESIIDYKSLYDIQMETLNNIINKDGTINEEEFWKIKEQQDREKENNNG